VTKKQKQKARSDPATQKFTTAKDHIDTHPLFAPLMREVVITRAENAPYPKNGYAIVTKDGYIHAHPKRHEDVDVWIYVFAHCLLHLGFEHFKEKHRQDLWNIACDLAVAKFLDDFKLGHAPNHNSDIIRDLSIQTEEDLYKDFLEQGVDKKFIGFGTGSPGEADMSFHPARPYAPPQPVDWGKRFGIGLRHAVASAVNVAAGKQESLGAQIFQDSKAQRARDWFLSAYPLLGSLAANFDIIEDQRLCHSLDISVAAVHIECQEIYINPAAGLTEEECKFVIAHELLHVGLRHDTRRQGRDPFLWNVACDFVINGWLIDMSLGDMPAIGTLYDPDLKGESAESIYDKITTDLRQIRKFATYHGVGTCDILDPHMSGWQAHAGATHLDHFYRQCLMQGLDYHQTEGRGYLPAGLIEDIKTLAQPPISWDVALARWFEDHFAPLEKIRSYARPSRRQSSSPDILRPRYVTHWEAEDNRTFGVILDTSGSMDRALLAKAIGAIASYSLSRDVSHIRLVFCDAVAYDQGYVSPDDLSQRVRVKGRGGTLLQPGIDLLQKAEDFPKDGPLLIITDGGCERVHIRRDHAFLMPASARLPFTPKGKIFRIV